MFGPRIGVLLEHGRRLTLPKRFADVINLPEHLEDLNARNLVLTYKGIDKSKRNMIIVDLKSKN